MTASDAVAPVLAAGVGKISVRVYYEDTDAGGVVYYANYLRFLERGRTEFLRAIGVDQSVLLDEQGLGFVVARLEIVYRRPAGLDDLLEIATHVVDLGAARAELSQSVSDAASGARLAEATVGIALIDRDGRPTRMSSALRAALAAERDVASALDRGAQKA